MTPCPTNIRSARSTSVRRGRNGQAPRSRDHTVRCADELTGLDRDVTPTTALGGGDDCTAVESHQRRIDQDLTTATNKDYHRAVVHIEQPANRKRYVTAR